MNDWERTYGPSSAVDLTFDPPVKRRIDECWAAIRKALPADVWPKVHKLSWKELARIARQVGYADIADAWERGAI